MNTWTRRTAGACLVAGIVALSGGACTAYAASVLFDEGHSEKFLIGGHGQLDLSNLAAVFRKQGTRITSNRGALSDARLSGVDALIVSGAFKPFTPAEVETVTRFLNRGGRLSVMLHIPQPVAPLLHQLGVDFSNGVIREREQIIGNDPLNFRVTALSPHPLTQDLDGFAVFGAWALMSQNPSATIIAKTGPTAWIDLNGDDNLGAGDAVQAFGVAVAGPIGAGHFVVFGDDAIFQNQFLTGGNLTLAKNLARWLTHSAPSGTPHRRRQGV